jgi:hypothetical protein
VKRAAVVVCVVLFLSACGGGGNPETDQIKAAYTGFFAKGSLAAHLALMQDGPKFKSVVKSFLGNPLASSVSATVSKVTLQGPDKAKVIYSLKIGGFPLNNQTGYAVLQDGKWKVADATLCGLLSLDGIGAPAVCKA